MTLKKKNEMQSCNGCQFLVDAIRCRAGQSPDARLPPAAIQRRVGGPCGPEALLYQPTWWHRVRTWWSNGPV